MSTANPAMMLEPVTIQTTSLYFREGSFWNEFHAANEPKDDGFVVTFASCRRGGNLRVGTKTHSSVSLGEATRVFDKLIASKLAKGYHPSFPDCGPRPAFGPGGAIPEAI